MKDRTVLEEAAMIVEGPRRDAYGVPAVSFTRIAQMWSALLGTSVSPEQVALCMIALKLARSAHKVTKDSIVDIAGYARILELLAEYPKPSPTGGVTVVEDRLRPKKGARAL